MEDSREHPAQPLVKPPWPVRRVRNIVPRFRLPNFKREFHHQVIRQLLRSSSTYHPCGIAELQASASSTTSHLSVTESCVPARYLFCSDTKASGMYFAQGHAFIVEHNAQPTTCDRRYVGKIRQVEHMFDNCMIVVVTRGATRIFHICAPGDDAA